jgi:hypothetical protein
MLQATGHLGDRTVKGGQTYQLLKELPDGAHVVRAAYRDLFLTDIESAKADAEAELDCLKEEMGEWRDNMGQYDGLDQTELYASVEEVADTLDNLDLGFVDVPEGLSEIDVYDMPVYDTRLLQGRSKYLGRGRRAANTGGTLRTITDAIQKDQPLCANSPEILEFVNSLNEVADELESIDFPTM